jgi:hypothetical protein
MAYHRYVSKWNQESYLAQNYLALLENLFAREIIGRIRVTFPWYLNHKESQIVVTISFSAP